MCKPEIKKKKRQNRWKKTNIDVRDQINKIIKEFDVLIGISVGNSAATRHSMGVNNIIISLCKEKKEHFHCQSSYISKSKHILYIVICAVKLVVPCPLGLVYYIVSHLNRNLTQNFPNKQNWLELVIIYHITSGWWIFLRNRDIISKRLRSLKTTRAQSKM